MTEAKIYLHTDLNHIASKIMSGFAAVVETDTVVGLVAKDKRLLYELKRRDPAKPLVTFVREPVQTTNKHAAALMKRYWPGALTLVIKGVSYRMPDHKQLLRLLSMTGPLYSTSCNLSGEPTVKQCIDAKKLFGSQSARVIIVRGKQRDRMPSTVYDCDQMKVVRQGRLVVAEGA